ncbi:MAG: nucleotidyl transferase AbiEii/AbiGii toxin family protein [Desulfococcaceae bacterium]|nr:nucleotidyl transferase AbiEii/AbiGii toxin family protein [Desulfococcaceae bacterium]
MNTPFYLTGGTALSRCYFHHRYSDDLDFFVNAEDGYARYVGIILREIRKNQVPHNFTLDTEAVIAEEYYSQIIVNRRTDGEECLLKIDLINDVAERFGDISEIVPFGRVDNILNILSNKLTALYRFEPKDIADIWIISKNMRFQWKKMIRLAKEKEMGLDVLKISEIIKSFPSDYIDTVKWAIAVDKIQMAEELDIIAEDIFWGRENSLVNHT